MKKTLKIELPDRAALVAGLSPREVYPALVAAEQAATKAKHALEQVRRELAEHEHTVGALPVRIQRGEVKASALTDGMRERDAMALRVPAAEESLSRARGRVTLEEKNAANAVTREIHRRGEQLEKVAAELSLILDELRELSLALSRVQHPHAMGLSDVDWTCGLNCAATQHARAMTYQPQVKDTDK